MIKIIVCGALGRMGSRILELANGDVNFSIIGALEAEKNPSIGKKVLDGKIVIQNDLNLFKDKADVIIDFTSPEATLSHLETIQNWKGITAVIGTTGFSSQQKETIQNLSKKMALLLSPNMSVGVNLLLNLVRTAAKTIPQYDIEIIESHHNQKKDAPSGTAIALASEITDELKRNPNQDWTYGRQGNVGARKNKEIGIHAVRGGDIVGDHTVLFAGLGERIELTHRASSRDAFAIGALRAAQWLSNKKSGLYSMKDVLGN